MAKRRQEKDIVKEKQEQIERGKRIKSIRLNELNLNKTQLAKKLGISSQFLGLVENGRSNLTYRSIKQLKDLCGHSSDYILFGLDDNILNETKECLQKYSEEEIIDALNVIKDFTVFLKNR